MKVNPWVFAGMCCAWAHGTWVNQILCDTAPPMPVTACIALSPNACMQPWHAAWLPRCSSAALSSRCARCRLLACALPSLSSRRTLAFALLYTGTLSPHSSVLPLPSLFCPTFTLILLSASQAPFALTLRPTFTLTLQPNLLPSPQSTFSHFNNWPHPSSSTFTFHDLPISSSPPPPVRL